tara:strand:- start:917 stop:1498 length:582 start_codon:yes stop_codon:yes gene_type:complete
MNDNIYMDILDICKLSNKKYYIFLKKHKNIIEQYLKKNFISIKSDEIPLIKIEDIQNVQDYELEKIETLIWMLKYGFNNVRGSKFKNLRLTIKEFENIRELIKENLIFLKKYNIKNDWEKDLNNCIEKEKIRHKNTTCFICAKKGHFAIDCKELYDIDGIYIGEDNECKYCKKIIKKEKIKIHENECKKYYSS